MTALGERWLVPCTLLAAGALGAWAALHPGFLQLDPFRDPTALAVTAGAVALGAALMLRPDVGLFLFTATAFVGLSSVLVRYHGFPSLLQLLALPLLVAGVVERSRRSGVRWAATPVWGLGGYLAALFLSTTVALDPGLADAVLVEAGRGALMVGILALLTSDRRRVSGVVAALLVGGVVLAFLGVFQALTGDYANDFGGLARVKHAHIHGRTFEARIAGPLGDPNYFAQMLIVVFPLALFQAWEGARLRVRLAAWIATGVLVAAIALTYSRGGALALGLVVVLALLVHGTRARHLAAGAGLVLLSLFLMPEGFQERLATVRELLPGEDEAVLHRDSSFQERLLLGRVAWEMFAAHPLRGVGAGNYTLRFDEYADRVPSTARDWSADAGDRYPHNLFLEQGAEGGIVLLGAFGLLMVGTLGGLLRARRSFLRTGEREMAAMSAAVALGLTGYLVSSLFLHGAFQRHFWLLVGLALALEALSHRPAPVAPSTAPPAESRFRGGAS